MITNLSKVITVTFLLLFFIAGSAWAGVLVSENFDSGVPYPGSVVATQDGMGWTTGKGGDDLVDGSYIKIPLDLPAEGTLEFSVTRKGSQNIETLFAFTDRNMEPFTIGHLFWSGRYDKRYPTLMFEGTDRGIWWQAYDIPGFGKGRHIVRPAISLKRDVPVGAKIHLAITWGPEPGDSNVYVDGNKLDLLSKGSSIELSPVISGTRYLVIGAQPIGGTDGAWGLMKSVVESFVLHDQAFNAYYKDVPVSASGVIVNHDAFAVAGYSGKLVTGDIYKVTLQADPGGKAIFDLGPVKGHPMTESVDDPGTYIGVHKVVYGEDVEDGLVLGRFTNNMGIDAEPVAAKKTITIDTKVYMQVKPSNDLIPADEDSRAGITIIATDANGKAVRKHPLMLTMSTTDEYTGILGGINFKDAVGGQIEVDWGGVTDSFGEVTAQYVSGFAAKTILVSAKDMMTGDVGVGWIRSYIDGTVDIVVKQPAARALAIQGTMEVSVSRDWLTADGRSRSRITAVVKDSSGNPMEGNNISFNLLGDNGAIRVIKSRTDSRGRATADYIAGTTIGQVQIEVRDMTSGLVEVVAIELRPDAPAEISLAADPGEVFIGDRKGSAVTAKVTDTNGNPNTNTDVLFEIMSGEGTVSSPKVATDDRDGVAAVTFLPGNNPGVATVKATVMSREPTAAEIEAAEGAIFLYGLDEDPGRLDVMEWLAEAGDDVIEGQDLVILEDRVGDTYTVKAPQDGTLATFTAEERDRVEYGQTLGYVLPLPE